MSDLYLMVPMNIEALVVSAEAETRAQWVNLKPAFRGVYRRDQVLGQQLGDPLMFSPVRGLHKRGVHLHWALPDGLSHGVAASGGLDFPAVPNRWLVARLWDQSDDTQRPDLRAKAWIVESDAITKDENASVWPTLNAENLKTAEDYSVFAGRVFELSLWPVETGGARVDLTAAGYGDPAFAAHYPACKGLLGFHDQDLSDVTSGAVITYMVAGWYAAPAKDPLQQALAANQPAALFARLSDFLGAKKWLYPGYADAQEKIAQAKTLNTELKEAKEMKARLEQGPLKADAAGAIAELQRKTTAIEQQAAPLAREIAAIEGNLPARTLCHGILTGVKVTARVDSGVPLGKDFAVSLGETAVEALSALFETKCGGDLGKLLAVFQYDLLSELEKPDGSRIVDHKVHERCYRPLARGMRWEPAQERHPAFGGSPEARAPAIPGDVRLALEQVNRPQRRINQLKREREFLQSEVYAAWYKKVLNVQAKKISADRLDRRLAVCQAEIEGLSKEIDSLAGDGGERPNGAAWSALQDGLKKFLPDWTLQQLDEPQFWRPNDPVVLLAGDAFKRSPRHGEDGRYRADGQLLCRLSGQEIRGIKITIPFAKQRDVEFNAADIDRWLDPAALFGNKPLPQALFDLFREVLLLTAPANRARAIVTAAYEKNEAGLAASHAADIEENSKRLIDSYFKKIWDDAGDPEIDNPNLRYPESAGVGQTVWELIGRLPSPVTINHWDKNPWLPLFLQWQARWTPSYSDSATALNGWSLDGADFEWQGDAGGKTNQQVVYSGTTLLTPGATVHFSDRLRQYNLSRGNDKLRALQTAIHSINTLCQSLGGFTDQLMMRKSYLELRPLDPRKAQNEVPKFSPIFDTVKDIDWLSPLTEGKFFPLRAGTLKLERLWIIDAFGQFLKLEEEGQVKGLKPLSPRRLAAPDSAVRLAPRLVQAARLSLDWLPADLWDSPGDQELQAARDQDCNSICGWVVPNFLDSGLMIYDARGYAAGSLQANQRKSWGSGAGAAREPIASFHWVDLPGSETFFFGLPHSRITDPLGAAANPHLRAYLQGLLSLTEGSGQAFANLLKSINDALSAAGGTGDNPALALLIGKPLALVRARLRLEVDGRIARAQGWDAVDSMDSGGIEKVKFPLRLGDRRKWQDRWLGDDGLLGFFIGRDYKKFYPASGLEGRDDGYNIFNRLPEISLGETIDLTLIMDPARGVCVTSGILPRALFPHPYGGAAETLENKEVIFFTGPVIGPAASQEIHMPQPSDIYGQWSWTHHPDVKVWSEKPIADVQKEAGQFSETALRITEGWLKLIAVPLAIRAFTVAGKNPVEEEKKITGETTAPARFEAARGEKIMLSWSVDGAEEIELREAEALRFKSRRHPLPARFAFEAERDTAFTLVATGRAARPGAVAVREPAVKTIVITVKV